MPPFAARFGASSVKSLGWTTGVPFELSISSNQVDVNLRTYATAQGWNGSNELIVTLESGIYISSSSTGSSALTISGSFPQGVTFINNGIVAGRGGGGGGGAYFYTSGVNGSGGGGGGKALTVSSNVIIDNTSGIIAGGGGGGGGVAVAALAVMNVTPK